MGRLCRRPKVASALDIPTSGNQVGVLLPHPIDCLCDVPFLALEFLCQFSIVRINFGLPCFPNAIIEDIPLTQTARRRAAMLIVQSHTRTDQVIHNQLLAMRPD
jgi:hypothetical protein